MILNTNELFMLAVVLSNAAGIVDISDGTTVAVTDAD